MIICLCRGVSDRIVHQAIGDGARSLPDLQRCGIADQCGGCHDFLRKLLASPPPGPVHTPAVVPSPA